MRIAELRPRCGTIRVALPRATGLDLDAVTTYGEPVVRRDDLEKAAATFIAAMLNSEAIVPGKLLPRQLAHHESYARAACGRNGLRTRLRGKNPISGSQFVKDHIRPRFIKYGIIDAAYRGRAGLHAFRHSLATVLITEEQVDPKTAQGILSHANSDVTMQIYTHAQDDAKRKALEKFEARLVQ
jgi:hypothetical protein